MFDWKKYLADGRLFVVVAVGIYWHAYFVGVHNYNVNITKLYQFPVMVPSFADLRVITSAYDSADLDYDPMVYNICDPWERPFNYPRIWMVFSIFGITQKHTSVIGVALAFIFYMCLAWLVIPRIKLKTSIIYIIAVLSPAVVLGVERGNTDLIIFIILALALLFLRRGRRVTDIVSCLLILLSSILKLFPIFAFSALLKEKRKSFLIFLGICVFVFLGYLVLTYDDLVIINKNTPKPTDLTYGNMIIFDYWVDSIANLLSMDVQSLKILTRAASLILSFAIIVLALSSYNRLKEDEIYSVCNFIDALRIGSSIYVGTFLLGYNFNYRLIFLFFCIPQLIEWSKLKGNISLSGVAILLILISMWSTVLVSYTNPLSRLIIEVINWTVFYSLTLFLLLTSPEWLRKMFDSKAQRPELHETEFTE